MQFTSCPGAIRGLINAVVDEYVHNSNQRSILVQEGISDGIGRIADGPACFASGGNFLPLGDQKLAVVRLPRKHGANEVGVKK